MRWRLLTGAVDGTGVDLTVVPPAGPQRAAALLQGHVAGQHALTQVLIVQAVVALLALHRGGGLWDPRGGEGDGRTEGHR